MIFSSLFIVKGAISSSTPCRQFVTIGLFKVITMHARDRIRPSIRGRQLPLTKHCWNQRLDFLTPKSLKNNKAFRNYVLNGGYYCYFLIHKVNDVPCVCTIAHIKNFKWVKKYRHVIIIFYTVMVSAPYFRGL